MVSQKCIKISRWISMHLICVQRLPCHHQQKKHSLAYYHLLMLLSGMRLSRPMLSRLWLCSLIRSLPSLSTRPLVSLTSNVHISLLYVIVLLAQVSWAGTHCYNLRCMRLIVPNQLNWICTSLRRSKSVHMQRQQSLRVCLVSQNY